MGGSFFIGSRFTLSELAINIVSKASGSGFNDAESGLNRVDKAAKTATASLAGIGKDLTNVGKGLTAGITLPLLGIAAAAVQVGTELNAGMADVASLNLASERVIELKENVKDLQIQFGKSPDDLTRGLYEVESAFGDSADTINSLNLAIKAGVAGRATTSEALALISAETKGYGDTSLAAQQHVADLGLKTVELGKTNLPELSASIGMVTSMSKQLGISQEELHAGASALSGVIGTTSQVFTGQRGVMQSLMAPTDTMTKLMNQMGFKTGEAMVKGLGWSKTLQVITAASARSGIPLQSFIGSIEGQNYAMALSGDLLGKYTSDLDALGKVTEKTDAAYKAQTEGVNASGFAMQQARQMLNVFLEDLNDALGPAFLAFMDMLEPATTALLSFSKSLSGMDPSTQKWIVGIAAAVAAIGPLLVIIGAALPVIGMIGPALGALMGPLGLVIVGVGLLSAAWINDWGGIQEKTQAVIDYLKPGFGELLSWISSASKGDWGPLKAGLTGALQSVNATIQAFKWSDFVTKLSGWADYIKPIAWDTLVTALEWTTYVSRLSWATVLPTLTSWGDYIKAIDWKQVITTAIDWSTYVLALDWTLFVSVLDWGVKIGAFVWSEWISKIDWSVTVPIITWSDFISDLTWASHLPALAWSDFIKNLEWTGAIDKISWDTFVSSLTWSNFVTALSDWATYITALDWTKIITTAIDWATWIPALTWNTFVFALDWATYIASIDWGSKIPSLTWANFVTKLSGWGSYIVSLDWTGYVTKLASWSSYIGAFAWSSFVSKLNWPSSATTFAWSTWISKLTWPVLTFSWSAWIEKLTWPNIVWAGWSTYVTALVWPEIAWDGWTGFVDKLEWPVISWEGWSSFIPKFPGWPDIKSIVSSAVGSIPGAGAIGGAYNYITGHADGTGGFGGGWSWVGERGPELMKLPRGTQIMSNYESSKYIANNAAGTTTAPPSAAGLGLGGAQAAGFNAFVNSANKALDTGAKKMQAAIEKGAQALEGALSKVPGLFGTSEVTQKQLDMAKLGIPQNFADDYIRHLTDTVMNGKGWDGVDIKDAAMRAGIDPGLPAKVILDMVKEQWNDQSFFAGGKNTELINLDAVKAEIAKQQAQASGHASIMALFGIKSEDVTAQGGQLVDLLNQGIAGGMAGSGKGTDGKAQGNGIGTAIVAGAVADIKDSKVDAGGQLASALSAQLSGSTAFAGTGSTILQAIVDSWADATKSVDMLGGIAAALKIQVDAKDSVELLKNVGGRIAQILKAGIDDYFESSSVADSVNKSVSKATGTGGAGTGTPVADHKAIGTNSYAGGWSWVGESEPELLWIPPRAGVYPQRQMDQRRSGDTHIWNVTIQNDIDVQSLAYRVSQIQQRKRN